MEQWHSVAAVHGQGRAISRSPRRFGNHRLLLD